MLRWLRLGFRPNSMKHKSQSSLIWVINHGNGLMYAHSGFKYLSLALTNTQWEVRELKKNYSKENQNVLQKRFLHLFVHKQNTQWSLDYTNNRHERCGTHRSVLKVTEKPDDKKLWRLHNRFTCFFWETSVRSSLMNLIQVVAMDIFSIKRKASHQSTSTSSRCPKSWRSKQEMSFARPTRHAGTPSKPSASGSWRTRESWRLDSTRSSCCASCGSKSFPSHWPWRQWSGSWWSRTAVTAENGSEIWMSRDRASKSCSTTGKNSQKLWMLMAH